VASSISARITRIADWASEAASTEHSDPVAVGRDDEAPQPPEDGINPLKVIHDDRRVSPAFDRPDKVDEARALSPSAAAHVFEDIAFSELEPRCPCPTYDCRALP
jgi:hypothetical protein